eukprot:scaffold6708_cov134-Cylindrotheca_fusiformis.AAC.25
MSTQLSSSDSVSEEHCSLDCQVDRRAVITGIVGSTVALSVSSESANAVEGKRSIPDWTLENNVKMPTLALNTVGLSSEDTEKAVRYAKMNGITHIDFHPGKERDGVAQYIAKEGREGLFLSTKIRKPPSGTSPKDAVERARVQIDEDLKALGLDSVDMLMLRDSPDCDVMQAQWAVLEDALAAGQTRSVGVINFCEKALSCILETAKVKPSLNYYMLHIGMGRNAHGLRTFCETNGIRTFAYGAIGEPGPNDELLTSPILKQIGESHGKTPEEVALRWVLQAGAACTVRPTTNFGLGGSSCADPYCAAGIAKRASIYSWSLTSTEMKKLDGMVSPDGNPTLFSSEGCPNAFSMPN